MKPPDPSLLEWYDRRTRKGYPLGEVRHDLLEKGYTEAEADAFMAALGSRINKKVAHREAGLMSTAALILIACGIVLLATGSDKGTLFILAGAVWWIVNFLRVKG